MKKDPTKIVSKKHSWWKTMLRQYRPDLQSKSEAQMRSDRELIFTSLKTLVDQAKSNQELEEIGTHVTVFRRLLEDTYAWAYYLGLQKGLSVGAAIAKMKLDEKQDDNWWALVETIARNSKLTTRQLCEKLDERLPPVRLPTGLRKNFSRWTDAFNKKRGTIDTYISRCRTDANKLAHIKFWRRLQREHSQRRRRPADK